MPRSPPTCRSWSGSPAGTATMHELVTHTAGYAEFGAATVRRAAWKAPLGQNFFTADSAQMTEETRNQTLSGRGRYAYSTLGSAIAGQAVAAAAHLSYPDLMRTRLFEPLGMSAHRHPGRPPTRRRRAGRRSGLPVQPWVMDAYAPGAAAVSTTRDLAKLATALLDGTAPGMAALEPTTATDQSNTRIGDFWQISTWQTGQTITQHAGQTGGYASYLGLDRTRHKAVIVLSDVANDGATSAPSSSPTARRPPTSHAPHAGGFHRTGGGQTRATPPSDGGSYDLSDPCLGTGLDLSSPWSGPPGRPADRKRTPQHDRRVRPGELIRAASGIPA